MSVETIGYLAEYEQYSELVDPPRYLKRQLKKDTPEEIVRHLWSEHKRVPHRVIRNVKVFRLMREPYDAYEFVDGVVKP